MATVQCSKCTAERKGFRRELDSWRHKLIHCVGFESILEGIYGQILLRDLNLFDDCEPEEVDDWSPSASCSHCSFCSLPLDKLSDRAATATSPLSSSSDYSPCQAPIISESSQSAHRFLQAVFHKKDVPPGCDSNIPLVAQELMKKMICQFALEYASKCLLHTSPNDVTRTSSPLSDTSDAPLDLTVSRNQEEKEGERDPDGVLDLSNRNTSCSVTSSASSSNKASGSLPLSLAEDLGGPQQRENKCRQRSALDAVLSRLCPSHRSLLYQILKLAHQENLLLFQNHRPVGQMESCCCHSGVNPQDDVAPNAVPFDECNVHNSSLCYPLTDCDLKGHDSTVYHPGDCKSDCSIHHYPLTNCKREAPLSPSYCCLQRSRMETYSVLCPERLHYVSCQSLAVGCTNNVVCSTPSLCTPSSLCPSPICCSQCNLHSCPCYSNHACMTQVTKTIERVVEGEDPPFPVLKREQSPSPPPLSPIPSDINKKTNEKPPSLLHHRQEEEADQMLEDGLVNVSRQEACAGAATEDEQDCRIPRSTCGENPGGTSLQDVMNRFSEKLETIRPTEKDPPLVSSASISEKEPPQSPPASENLEFHADAHLTEIITTVLHTGSASDYNLSELFNRHDSKEPKSPNTRSRRRQEVLAAMATPANDVSARRHTLKIKRELAMFDQSHSKRKMPLAKRARLKDENVTIATSGTSSESKKEMGVDVEPVENHRLREGPQTNLTTERDQDEIKGESQTVILTEKVQFIKAEERENLISNEEKCLPLSGSEILTPELQSNYSKQDSKINSVQTKEITVIATSAKQYDKTCKDGKSNSDGNTEEAPSVQISDGDSTAGKSEDYHCPLSEEKNCQSHHSKRTRRNIVPPQRFSSYVTEPRKMFFVACFSENIFKQKTQKDEALTSSGLGAATQHPDGNDIQFESSSETPLSSSPEHALKLTVPLPESTRREGCGPSLYDESNSLSTNQVFPLNIDVKEESPMESSSNNGTDDSKPPGWVRSSRQRLHNLKTTSITPQITTNVDATTSVACVESPPHSKALYTSPIKLMFVSQVKDKEGVRYSLKSAGTGSNGEAEEPFDPCEESSWSGTIKHKNQSNKSCASRVKSISPPLKSATSPAKPVRSSPRSASSPSKFASSPPKSASSPSKSALSPSKSASSSPKSASSPAKSASSPSKSASSPSKSASSPSKSASLPSKSASPPSKSNSSPSKSASSPPKSASSPPKSASSPSKSASSPPKSASSPSRSASSPSKSASSPSKFASSPPKSASSPSKSASSPSKSKSSPSKSASSPSKSKSSPSKSASSPSKSKSSPSKSASSPSKSKSSPSKSASSPKSVSSPSNISSRRSGEATPTKRVAGTESQRSPGGALYGHETPPKRRPGRPKKLGPQLEKKVKRPIGRPRKQKAVDSVIGANAVKGKSDMQSDVKENVNKNLKITVVYGRSRRNKRTVSEGCDQLQTEFQHTWQAVGLKSGVGILMHNSGSIKTTATEFSEELNFVSHLKESAPQSCGSIKCQKQDVTVPSRKPGRPAKVRISGISVTVTTVSPQQRKIQINKDTRQSPETLIHKKVLPPELKSPQDSWTVSRQSTNKISLSVEGIETKDENKDALPNQPAAVRHSMRVRKPSIHFLYAVATSTSRSYSHSNALLRRSKQLLLNKASNQRKQVEQQSSGETSGGKRQLCGRERKNISQDLSRVAGLSMDSIFSPKETLKWWAASAEEKTMNLELARRIRLISDTWVSDTVDKKEKEIALSSKVSATGDQKAKRSSVVRTLFDCSPNKPRSCSMQQLCSWFMQTTETQSLAIVKKASSRNRYELMHFPRSANKKSVCHSPQAERLHKHIKKFAKIVPKSPLQNHQAQKRLRKRNMAPVPTHSFRRQLFAPRVAAGQCNRRPQGRRRGFGKYQACLFRAKTRFQNQKQREKWRKRQRIKKKIKVARNAREVTLYQNCRALCRSTKKLSDRLDSRSVDQTQEPMHGPKEQNLCSKAWSPETLKECRVFLRKINSPHNESTEEEWNSCTVTLDDGSPSTYVFASRERELVEVVKAVKTKRKGSVNGTASREQASSAPRSVPEKYEMPKGRQKGNYKRPGALSTESPRPPPAKMLRQSRMRGLTGPRWCDFVLENK